jgi:N-succinyldiaminopimelate aminotransferase
MTPATRTASIGTTIFSAISALAREHGAVNLGQGFPDFDGPEEIRRLAGEAIAAGHNQYAITHGEAILREAIAEHSERFYARTIDPNSEVTVTSGATEGIWDSAFAFIEPGDEVIVFEPCYDSYLPAIRMAGGTPVAVTLEAPTFRFDPEELRRAISSRTSMIIVNTPHNPTGRVLDREELELIASLAIERDLLVIVDEVYEHIVYPGSVHMRLANLPGMWERTLTLSSAGKSFSLTGWKVGWAIGPAALQSALRKIHQFTVFSTVTPLQYAVAGALRLGDDYFTELADDYRKRRDYLMNVLATAGLDPIEPEGSYFIMARFDTARWADGPAFVNDLITTSGVAAIPVESFYIHPERASGLVRFCFCKRWETLEAAGRRLRDGRDDGNVETLHV